MFLSFPFLFTFAFCHPVMAQSAKDSSNNQVAKENFL